MTANSRFSPLLLLLIGTASFVIVIAGLQAASPILNAFFLSLIIVINVSPLLQLLIKRGLSAKFALLVTILCVLGVGVVLMVFLGISIGQLLHILPEYEDRIATLKLHLIEFLTSKGINASGAFANEALQPSSLLKAAIIFLKQIVSTLGSSLLLLLIVAFMLVESTVFPLKLQKVLKPDGRLIRQLTEYSGNIRTYMWITAWTGALSAFGDFLVLMVLGVDLAPLWGMMFFLLSFVPGIGFLLAILPPMALALLEYDGGRALWVFFGCWLIDNIVDKAIKPRFMQEGLDLSILVIILSILFWSWVLGPMGAILSVPLTMMVKKVILESYEDTRFMAHLLGAGSESPISTTGNDDKE